MKLSASLALWNEVFSDRLRLVLLVLGDEPGAWGKAEFAAEK